MSEFRKILNEFKPPLPSSKEDVVNTVKVAQREFFNFIHVPFVPALHRPGWLLRYIVGPYDKLYFEK